MKIYHLAALAALAAVAGLLSLPTSLALGTTFTVTKAADTYDGACDADCSLREAIVFANANIGADTITLPAGTYTLTVAGAGEEFAITGDLDVWADGGATTVNGAGAGVTVIDGNGPVLGDRVIQVNQGELVLSGVTVRNGNTSGDGGGIWSQSDVTLNNSTVSDNIAGWDGGGIRATGTVTLNNSTVSNNAASNDGGGIYNTGAITTLNDSNVSNNTAPYGFGGGIYSVASTLQLNNSGVSGNTAAGGGGGIASDSDLTLNASTVTGNGAPTSGGGIWNGWAGVATINNSTVAGNSSVFFGGGIANDGALTVNDSSVSNNSSYHGGGIYGSGTVGLNNATVSGNSATYYGGGLTVPGGGSVTVNSSTISRNVATNYAGGIWNAGNTSVTNSVVRNNSTGGFGGGLHNQPVGTLTVNDSTLVGNSSYAGGGFSNLGTAIVTNTTISGNSGSLNGGGTYGDIGSSLSLYNSTLSGNSALAGGGGVHNNGAAMSFRGTIVANSLAGGSCSGDPVSSFGYNLSSDATCAFTFVGDRNSTDPRLGPLAYNGGTTPTHALMDGSPAADGGGTSCPSTDQRGTVRPQGLWCDTGAFEALDFDGDGASDPLDADDDGDGIPDAADDCRTAAEDLDIYQDGDGCPEPDNDFDGICDDGQSAPGCTGFDMGQMCFDPAGTISCTSQDCRNVAEDIDGFRDSDGCPEPDNDNDGATDVVDACPGLDWQAGTDGMFGSPQDLNHNGIKDLTESTLTTDDLAFVVEDHDGVLDADGCHDSPGADYDADGFTDDNEALSIGTNAGYPCGTGAWPADLVSGVFSKNKVTIEDLASFIAPVRHFDTSPGDPNFSARWDLVPGRGVFQKYINLVDLAAVVPSNMTPTAYPPMLNGLPAFGQSCPMPAQ